MTVTNTLKVLDADPFLQDKILRVCREIMVSLHARVARNVRDVGAIATSNLEGSFDVVEQQLKDGVGIRFGSSAEYGAYVEFGTRAHGINAEGMEALKKWVEIKLNVVAVGLDFSTGKARPTEKGSIRQFSRIKDADARSAAIERTAYAIARNIRWHGTKARHFMKTALDGLGLKYEVVQDADSGSLVYNIDIIHYLENRSDLWNTQ